MEAEVRRQSAAVIRSARLPLALLPFLAHALARELDRALGLVLRAEVEPAGLVGEVGRALAADAAGALTRISLWLVAWAAATLGLAWWRKKGSRADADAEIERPKLVAWPLLLRPALTLLALLSVALAPAYPYAFTLPVALTQDWSVAQDVLALAVLAAALPALRFPAPRAVEVFALGFLAYAALVPEWAWHWDSHPGNEPKTLRQAVALGHWLTFDAEAVSGPMETLGTRPLGASLASGAVVVARESWAMLGAVARGAAGRDAIRATRIARQVVRGKDGGVYSVLAPGPSLLLAPALRADRALNRARGVEGRVAVSVLLFCGLGAGLVAALYRLVRDATGREGLAAALALFFSVVPPFLFYFHQFYPEMLGALVLAIAFRTVALRPERIRLDAVRFGALVALLPWLHQKFLPVWGVLLATALFVGWRDSRAKLLGRSGWAWALRVLAPNLASLYLLALYNFAITGSVRPDALFLAWGPGGVTSARLGQGLLGLLLDARYGILPYVPLLVLAAGGLVLGGARLFAPVLPAAIVYYLTVASADNWSGAVCNLGSLRHARRAAGRGARRVAIARTAHRRGVMALALALAVVDGARGDRAATTTRTRPTTRGCCSRRARSPTDASTSRACSSGAGRTPRRASWRSSSRGALLIAGTGYWLKRAAGDGGNTGRSPLRLLAGLAATLLVSALALEQATAVTRSRPAWPGELRIDAQAALFLRGSVTLREDEAVVGPGAIELLLRAPEARDSVGLTLGGAGGFAHPAGRPPQQLRPSGAFMELPLSGYHDVRGRDRRAVFSRGYLWLEQEAVLRPSSMEPGPGEVR